jgi:hypothetical protein
VTSVVVVGDGISFWRNRQSELVAEAADEEVVSEFARVVAACRDHLKSEIEDVYIYVRPPAISSLDDEIGKVTGRRVQFLSSPESRTGGLPPAEKKILESFGMTFAGLLENQN